MSTGSPNGPLVLARPTLFDGSPQPCLMARPPMSTGSPNGPLVLARPTSFDGSPNGSTPSAPPAAKPARHRSPAEPAPRSGFFPGKKSKLSSNPTVSANLPGIGARPRHLPGIEASCLPSLRHTKVGIPTSLYTVGIPTSLFCPKNPSPGQRRRSGSDAVLAASLPECFFSPFTRPAVNPGVGAGLLTAMRLLWLMTAWCPATRAWRGRAPSASPWPAPAWGTPPRRPAATSRS